jgi:hypothetical protein
VCSLKKTVMKIRPQVSGPTDVGFGNYILTAPVDRGARHLRPLQDRGARHLSSPLQDRGARTLRPLQDRKEVLDVDELMADINTLSRPGAKKSRRRTEL